MRTPTLALLMLVSLMLVACGGGNTAPAAENNPSPSIVWERDANEVVFRADVVGGPDLFADLNDIPHCTVYGDNRVVWTDISQPGRTIVFFDVVTDAQIESFVADLTVNERIFTYDGLAAIQPPGETRPVYEELILNVNGDQHITDGFAEWPGGYFRDVMGKCKAISAQPALFEPNGGWLSTIHTDYDPTATVIQWNAESAGISLAEVASTEASIWVDNELVPIFWNILTNSPTNRIFEEDELYFEVAFQVPNVMRDAPPVPEDPAAARLIPDIENP